MSDPRLTQSPRALRDSTENADADAKGKVQWDMNESGHDPINHDVWDLSDDYGPEGPWGDR